MNMITTEPLKESKQTSTNQGLPAQSATTPVNHPWRRFFARMFDIFLYRSIWEAFLILVFRYNISARTSFESLLASFVGIGLTFVFEPIFLWRFAATPGKALLGFTIKDKEGGNLSYQEALLRTWNLIKTGFGFNIPFYSLWRLWKSYKLCKSDQEQPWDESTHYELKDTKRNRIIIMASAYFILQVFSTTIFSTLYLAPNRGDNLTISQFAQNYEYYREFFGAQYDDKYLDENAQWKDKIASNEEIIAIGYTAMPEFQFKLENDRIKEVSFDVEVLNSTEWVGSYQTHMFITSMALLGSQKELGLNSNIPVRLLRFINSKIFESFEFSEANVSIKSTTEFSGYDIINSDLLIPQEGTTERHFKLIYQAIIGNDK